MTGVQTCALPICFPVTIPHATTPSAPTINSITAGNTQLSVAFTAGATGGSAITNYQYSTNNGSTFTNAGTTSSPITITGLTNGTTYSVIIRAINAIGTGTNSNMVTGTPSAPTFVTDSLFVKLDATNYTSGTWNDETANGNNATITGATWSATDGGIFDLDGTNDTISIPHRSSLSLSTSAQRTIQVWVKFDTLPSSGAQMPVFGKLSSSFGFDGYWSGLNNNGGLIRSLTNGTSRQTAGDSTLTISINTWYLYTFISQITSTSNTTKVYINTTEYISTAHGNDSYSESNPLYIGFIGTGIGSSYLNGKVGAVYFYTKGLSVSEITQNYNATKSKYGL